MITAGNGGDDANGDEANQGADAESAPDVDANIARLEVLAAHAGSGDLEALAELRRVFDEHPEIWKRLGDVSSHVEANFIVQLCGRNRLVAESIRRQVAELRESLLGDEPSPIEKLLVDQVVATWLSVQHAQQKASETPHDDALTVASFHEKRLASARKQFQQAVRSLELLRGTSKRRHPAPTSAAELESKPPVSATPMTDPTAEVAPTTQPGPGAGPDRLDEEFEWVSAIPLDGGDSSLKLPPGEDPQQ